MGRPPGADAERTRATILDAVLLEVAQSGFAELTLKAVASRAGVSIGLISHHFTNRDTLLRLASERWTQMLLDAKREVFDVYNETADKRAALFDATVAALAFVRRHHGAMRVVMRKVIVDGVPPSGVFDYTHSLKRMATPILQRDFGLSEARAGAVLHQAAILLARIGIGTDDEMMKTYGGDAATAWHRCSTSLGVSIVCLVAREGDELLARYDRRGQARGT